MDLTHLLPVPPLHEAKHILCVMPHPDDNEVGAGGTIARLAAGGARITYLGVTDGSAGTLDPQVRPADLVRIRRTEQEQAAADLGVAAVEWLGYPDGAGLPADEVRTRLIEAVRRHRPDFLMTVDPWLPYEAHPDHRVTGLAVAEAALLAAFPHVCPGKGLAPHAVKAVAFYATARPNTYVDIDGTWEQKLTALGRHASQFPGEELLRVSFYLDLRAREMAQRAGTGCERAESFKVLTPTHMHMLPDTAEG